MLVIDIKDSLPVLERNFMRAFLDEINKATRRAIVKIDRRIRLLTRSFLESSDTYRELAGGELEAHFGFPKGTGRSKADALVIAITEGMKTEFVEFKLRGRGASGRIDVKLLTYNMREIFSLPTNIIEVFNLSRRYPEGKWLPWARWLHLRGDDIIVSKHEIRFEMGRGRSGQAYMKRSAGVWRVPPEHSGTRASNWITRAITYDLVRYQKIIAQIIDEELNRMAP